MTTKPLDASSPTHSFDRCQSPQQTTPVSHTAGRGSAITAGRIDLLLDSVVSFAELARRIPKRRDGRPTHVCTLHRWRIHGLRGVRLAAVRVGSVWCSSMIAYEAFCHALTYPQSHEPMGRLSAETDRRLDEVGI
jgi:hypothetical protein